MMDTKYLSILSFQRDQNLLNLLNKLLIHIKLKEKGVEDRINPDDLKKAKQVISDFLNNIIDLTIEIETKKGEPLIGVDLRLRSLAREFEKAKRNNTKFKSELFKNSPNKVLEYLENFENAETQVLIDSLTELRVLIEEHISLDKKELLNDI